MMACTFHLLNKTFLRITPIKLANLYKFQGIPIVPLKYFGKKCKILFLVYMLRITHFFERNVHVFFAEYFQSFNSLFAFFFRYQLAKTA